MVETTEFTIADLVKFGTDDSDVFHVEPSFSLLTIAKRLLKPIYLLLIFLEMLGAYGARIIQYIGSRYHETWANPNIGKCKLTIIRNGPDCFPIFDEFAITTLTVVIVIVIILPSIWHLYWRKDNERAYVKPIFMVAFVILVIDTLTILYSRYVQHNPGMTFGMLLCMYLSTFTVRIPTGIFVSAGIAFIEKQRHTQRYILLHVRNIQSKLLNEQVSPHSLFNSLNTIARFATTDVQLMQKAIKSMANYLRGLIESVKIDLIPIECERKIVQDYLDFEKLCWGDQLNYEWSWSDDLKGEVAPPLLLLPLVENAIKHGIAKLTRPGVVRIETEINDQFLYFRVRNTMPVESTNDKPLGTGVRNMRERLKLIYGKSGSQACYKLSQENEWMVAEVRFPRGAAYAGSGS